MKKRFNLISYNLLLSSSLIATGMTSVSAQEDLIDEQQLAMYKPDSAHASSHFSKANLSAEKMLAMANSLYSPKMSSYQKNLEFSLVYSAAKKGLSEAQFKMANYYIDGDMVENDESEASFWLEEAIEQGHEGAKFVYGSLYYAENFEIGC